MAQELKKETKLQKFIFRMTGLTMAFIVGLIVLIVLKSFWTRGKQC